jgi:hypothetical protein
MADRVKLSVQWHIPQDAPDKTVHVDASEAGWGGIAFDNLTHNTLWRVTGRWKGALVSSSIPVKEGHALLKTARFVECCGEKVAEYSWMSDSRTVINAVNRSQSTRETPPQMDRVSAELRTLFTKDQVVHVSTDHNKADSLSRLCSTKPSTAPKRKRSSTPESVVCIDTD